jgi:hypothetical protein
MKKKMPPATAEKCAAKCSAGTVSSYSNIIWDTDLEAYLTRHLPVPLGAHARRRASLAAVLR